MGRTLWHRQCSDTCGVLQLVLSGSSSPCRQSNIPPCRHTPRSPSPNIPPPWPACTWGFWLCFTPPLSLQCTPPRDGVHWAWNCRHTWPTPSPHARTLSCLQTEILLKALYININLILKDHPWLISSHLLKDTVHVYTVSLFCLCTSEHSSLLSLTALHLTALHS